MKMGIITHHEVLNSKWFDSLLLPEELRVIEQKSTVVRYGKRETIIKNGEFVTHMLVLLDGFVKVEMNEGKKNFIVDIVPSHNIIGFPVLLSAEKHFFNITSLTDSMIRFVPIELIKDIIESNGKFAYAFLKYSNDSFTIPMLDKLHCLSQNNIRGRLAKLIIHLSSCTHRCKKFSLLITRTEMAQMIGFSRENVIRMLTEFHNEGIINVKGKSIELNNLSRLDELAKYS
jgi:CRP/FNR family transcriptional regulator